MRLFEIASALSFPKESLSTLLLAINFEMAVGKEDDRNERSSLRCKEE
jgi:hypothetical protein